MLVYLFRHAEKDIKPFHDPDLTEYGMRQALLLSQKIEQNEIIRPQAIFSSPKLRAENSMIPTAKTSQITLQKTPKLLERQRVEDYEDFTLRVQKSLLSLEALPHKCIFLCTHYDYLEVASEHLSQHSFSWSPLSFALYDYVDGIWNFKKFGENKL